MTKLRQVVFNGWPDQKANCPVDIHQFWPYRDKIVCQDSVLFKGNKVIIPSPTYKEMLHAIHCSYMGAETCLTKAKEVLFWPGMPAQVRDFILKCAICNQFLSQQPKEPMIIHDVPDRPWSKLAIDLFAFNGKDYVIITLIFLKLRNCLVPHVLLLSNFARSNLLDMESLMFL